MGIGVGISVDSCGLVSVLLGYCWAIVGARFAIVGPLLGLTPLLSWKASLLLGQCWVSAIVVAGIVGESVAAHRRH